MGTANPCHFWLNSMRQKKCLSGLLVQGSGLRKLPGVLNFARIVEHSTEFNRTGVKRHAKGMEFQDELIGCLKNKLGMTNETVGGFKLPKQLVGVVSVSQHMFLGAAEYIPSRGQPKRAFFTVWRKSSPVISTRTHISAKRDLMRSPMRSPRVGSRAERSASVLAPLPAERSA